MRILFGLLLFSSSAGAQQLTNLTWPARDIGSDQTFGFGGCAQDGRRLAISCSRESENPHVRVYVREGLNWIEDARLIVAPRVPEEDAYDSFGSDVDLDGDRILVGGAGAHLFKLGRSREWTREEIHCPHPPPRDQLGRNLFGGVVALGGEWAALSTDDTVHLFQEGPSGWTALQAIPSNRPQRLDIDGDNLLISESGRVRIFRRIQDAWSVEFELGVSGFSPFLPADLDGDELGLLVSRSFQSWSRAGNGWLPSGAFATSANHVALSGERAYVHRTSAERVEVLMQGVAGWTLVDSIVSPDPLTRLGQRVRSMSAAGPLLVVATSEDPVEHVNGVVATYSVDPATQATLVASHARLALVAGDTLTLTLDAGAANAGKVYFLRGSITGCSPGIRLAGSRIPLNARNDPYFAYSRQAGRLDGAGQALVQIQLPPVQPGDALAALKDRTLSHAFVIWEQGRGLTHISNVTSTALRGRLR